MYTDSETVLNALKKVFYDASNEGRDGEQQTDLLDIPTYDGKSSPRRTSGASSVSGYCSEAGDRERSHSCDSTGLRIRRRILQQQSTTEEPLSWIPEGGSGQIILQDDFRNDSIDVIDVVPLLEASLTDRKNSATDIFNNRDNNNNNKDVNMNYMPVPSTSGGSSCLDTVIEVKSGSTSPASSNNTLMGSSGSSSTGNMDKNKHTTTDDNSQRTSTDISNFFQFNKTPKSPVPERKQFKSKSKAEKDNSNELSSKIMAPPKVTTTNYGETDSIQQQQASTNDLTCSEQSINNINISVTTNLVMSSRLQPINNLMNRRPSAGANVIPHAALFHHRHSLQLNSAAEAAITKVLFFNINQYTIHYSLIFYFIHFHLEIWLIFFFFYYRIILNKHHLNEYSKHQKDHEKIYSQHHKKNQYRLGNINDYWYSFIHILSTCFFPIKFAHIIL